MSEIRQDPVSGTWAIVSPERVGRPQDFARDPSEAGDPEKCPLCPGHEHMTPPERFRVPGPGGDSSWTTRVVPNKYPFVNASEDVEGAEETDAPPPYRGLSGFGVHEVIVETPDHSSALSRYTLEQARSVIDTMIARIEHWRDDGRSAQVLVWRNWGRAAGASLAHPHMQLATLPRVPDAIVREVGNFMTYASEGKGCLMCATQEADDSDGRTVFDDGITLVQSPWAATVAYALRISPRECSPTIAGLGERERDSLARALVVTAGALKGLFGEEPAYNLLFHVAPYIAEKTAGLIPFHWHVEVLPRKAAQAGFEWASGMYTNLVDPDEAAEALRAQADVVLGAMRQGPGPDQAVREAAT